MFSATKNRQDILVYRTSFILRCWLGADEQLRILLINAQTGATYPITDLEELPAMRHCFDVVLCMGILYHRRSPLETLLKIHGMIPPGGQLVLETLILESSGEMALCPQHRYAKMKNIYFIPTLSVLTGWLARTGFDHIRCVDVSVTTSAEQRQTEWIDTESLADFLDPKNPRLTIEGYPAPVRAMVLANARP